MRIVEPNLIMGGTGLEPLPLTCAPPRADAHRDAENPLAMRVFTLKGPVGARRRSSARKRLECARWSKRGPNGPRAESSSAGAHAEPWDAPGRSRAYSVARSTGAHLDAPSASGPA